LLLGVLLDLGDFGLLAGLCLGDLAGDPSLQLGLDFGEAGTFLCLDARLNLPIFLPADGLTAVRTGSLDGDRCPLECGWMLMLPSDNQCLMRNNIVYDDRKCNEIHG
jgi:hypothetical protein